MYTESHQYDPHGFEQQPLVSTGTTKGDIDSFLGAAKREQKKFFLLSTLLSILTLAYAGYLFSQFPRQMFQLNANFNPIGSSCSPSSFPSWFFTATHVLMVIIPTICWIDSLKQVLSPSPTQNGSVLVFKPSFVRNTSDTNFTAPDTLLQRIRTRALTTLQAAAISTAIFSLIGLTGTVAMSPSSLCASSFGSLRLTYFIGLFTFAAASIGMVVYTIYQHKRAMMSHLLPSSSANLDHYHPL